MNTVNLLRVASVYSGKNGKCMCGCSGRHTYASAFVATNNPGYDPDVSDRSVGTIVKKMNALIASGAGAKFESAWVEVVDHSGSQAGRVYVAYYAKELVGDLPHRAGLQGC